MTLPIIDIINIVKSLNDQTRRNKKYLMILGYLYKDFIVTITVTL